MQIDDLAGNTVKITLEPSDMSGYHIKSEDISGHSHSAELALSRLISCLSEDHGLKLCGERLLVEAFPKSNGGCILYISCLKGTQKNTDRSSRNNEIVCTGTVNELAALCKALKRSSHKALLYYCTTDNSYRLLVYPTSDITAVLRISAEYSVLTYTDELIVCDTKEYYSLLTDKALDILPSCF